MRFVRWTGLLIASLLVLGACSPAGNGSILLEPTTPASDVALDEVAASDTLFVSGDSKRVVRVLVDPDYGDQVIVMVSEGIVRAFDGSGHIASSSLPERFTSREIVSLGANDEPLSPQIETNSPLDFQCVGPCVAVDAQQYDGVIEVEIENNASAGQFIDLFIVGAPYFDGLENANDVPADAVDLPNLGFGRTGAIETLGDEDWFRANATGSYDFIAPSGFAIEVTVYFLGDTSDPNERESFEVSAGATSPRMLVDTDLVRVTAAEYAGTAYSSSYEIFGNP